MAQPASRTGQTRSQTQRNTWWPFFCNQRTRINKAWRDDCTNSKTGGMSTKLGRQSQETKPKFDQTFADQPPHPGSTWMCPKRPGTGIPAILDDLMEATPKKTPVSSPKKTPNHNGIFAQRSCPEGKKRGDGDPALRGRKEERCKFCGGTPRVFNHPKNGHRKPTDHDVLVQAPTVKVEPLDPTPPGPPASEGQRVDRRGSYRSNRDAVGHFTGNFAGYDATGYFAGYDATGNFTGYDATGYFAGRSRPAERGEERRWRSIYSSRAVGGDGGHYAAVPNVDPGGQQRPEVIGGFEDPSRSRVRDPDRRRHFLIHTSQWTFPTCLRGPKEEALSLGVTGQTETASRSPSTQDFSDGTRVPKRKPKPEQVGNSKEIVYVPHLYFRL